MTNTNKQGHMRGFTLIELLVVIAIIGILASVVLASLNSARDKGEDAATKSNLNNIRAQAELYYDDQGRSYDAVCTADVNVARALSETAGTCAADDDGWTATALMNTGEYYCVDSTGNSATTSAGIANGTAWAVGAQDCSSL